MTLVNLTPHEVVLCGMRIKPDGTLARVSMTRKQTGQLDIDGTIVPIYSTAYGTVTGLPRPNDGIGYIVSALVRSAAPERLDIYSPADLVRDERGNVVGCNSLDQSP
jgi:hypothetical protein